MSDIRGQSTLCIMSFVGIIMCPVLHCQAATVVVGSSQSPKANSGYNTAHEAAIPDCFYLVSLL